MLILRIIKKNGSNININKDNNVLNDINVKRVNSNDISTFKELGIRLIPPIGWNKGDMIKDKNKFLVFISPFSDNRRFNPSFHEETLTMAISIDSLQHSGVTDYRVIHMREKDDPNNSNTNNWHWITKFTEVSASDKERILEKTNSSYFLDKKYQNPSDHALFSFDLHKINYPQQYRVLFYITDYFVLSHIYCRLVDTTNWIMIPPPQFEIISKPNSLTLRPGENSTVEITIKGNVDLPSKVQYTSKYVYNNANYRNEQDQNNKKLQVNFVQNKISVSPSGIGTSTLKISVPSSYNVYNMGESLTIPISANISFPTTITNRGGESFSNSKNQSTATMSNLTLTVLPPFTPEERLNHFVNTVITPISGMWSFLAGVAAVLTPAIIKFYNKKKKRKRDNGYEIDY